jgi:hypothetical protein
MGNFLSNLVKVALVGGLAYGAYKAGEHNGIEKGKRSVMSDDDKEEIDHLKGLIYELKKKKNKTKSDEYNLQLLRDKLYELENE